jgi:aryl-phospho-beta-D-glucosidase BglC (GH1 family)
MAIGRINKIKGELMMNKWTKEIPTKDGTYWFYGELWTPHNEPEPELEIIQVRKISNGYCYISHGTFVHESEGMQGLWLKMELPVTPTDFKYQYNDRYYWCNNPKCTEYHKHWQIEWQVLNGLQRNHTNTAKCGSCYETLELVSHPLA